MRKDRNTFFTNYNAQTQSYIPNNVPTGLNNQFGPYQAASSNSSFYSGPDIGMTNELDNRLTKLENNPISNTEIKENNYSNMYML